MMIKSFIYVIFSIFVSNVVYAEHICNQRVDQYSQDKCTKYACDQCNMHADKHYDATFACILDGKKYTSNAVYDRNLLSEYQNIHNNNVIWDDQYASCGLMKYNFWNPASRDTHHSH